MGFDYRTSTGLGKQTLGGHKQNLVHTRTQEKGAVTPKEAARECLGVSGRGLVQPWPVAGLGALSVAVHAWDCLKEVTITFITSTIVWPQVKQRGNTTLPINRKLD